MYLKSSFIYISVCIISGKQFTQLYRAVWENCWSRAQKRIEDISSKRPLDSHLRIEFEDESLDEVFNNVDEAFSPEVFWTPINGINTMEKHLEAVFKNLEKNFNEKMAKRTTEAKKEWIFDRSFDIRRGTYDYALGRAFLAFYNEEKFQTAFKTASEAVISDDDVEGLLQNASDENGLNNELVLLTEKILANRFRKFYLDFKDE